MELDIEFKYTGREDPHAKKIRLVRGLEKSVKGVESINVSFVEKPKRILGKEANYNMRVKGDFDLEKLEKYILSEGFYITKSKLKK